MSSDEGWQTWRTVPGLVASGVARFGDAEALVDGESCYADRAEYCLTDPAMIDGLEYAYLEGAPGPQIETRQGFEVDGVQMKVRLDFGCGWVDHRSWFKNDGA